MSSGGRFYWVRNGGERLKVKGIIAAFAWISISDAQLREFTASCSSLGWDSLVCRADYLNPFIPERATSLSFSVIGELVKELRCGLCPVVLVSFSGGSKACMYKLLQIIEGCSELESCMEDNRLLGTCISGQIYDSDPIEFTSDLGARFALHHSILKFPGSSKLVSWFAQGVTSSLDALFITRFGSQRADYWKVLYSSVGLGAPFLILCAENDDVAPLSTLTNFAQHLQDTGGYVKVMMYTPGHVKHHHSMQYTSAIADFLQQSTSIFSEKIRNLGDKSCMIGTHDQICDLICDLQNAAVDSNQSFGRVAIGPNDHFFLPSSSYYENGEEFGSIQQARKEWPPTHSIPPCMSANSVLGQALFDACVPKNVEGWDIKFSGSLNGEPFASVRKRPHFRGIKLKSRL